jgi:inorganic pyrophosphatase
MVGNYGISIGTVQKSRKTKNTTLFEQFKNLEKQKIPHYWNSPKSRRKKKYHTIGTVQKSRKTKNTTLLEKFKNLEKQKIPHYWNSSKI